jgi:predicted nucleic acid-binding Zn ribbon protein
MTTYDDKKDAIAENEKRIEVHEAVCAERYQGILDRFIRGDRRMQRIEYILYFLMLMALVGRDGALKLAEVFIK